MSLGVGAGWPGGGEERSGSLRLPQSCSRVPGAAWPLAPSSEPPPAAPVPACPASEHVAGGTSPPLLALPLRAATSLVAFPCVSPISVPLALCFSRERHLPKVSRYAVLGPLSNLVASSADPRDTAGCLLESLRLPPPASWVPASGEPVVPAAKSSERGHSDSPQPPQAYTRGLRPRHPLCHRSCPSGCPEAAAPGPCAVTSAIAIAGETSARGAHSAPPSREQLLALSARASRGEADLAHSLSSF